MSEKRDSLYDISWQVDEATYRADKSLSYSTIARFHREGFDGLGKLFDKIESPSLLFGSLVDILITGTQQEFDDNFIVAEFPDLPDSQINIVKTLFDRHSNSYTTLEDIPQDVLISITTELEFQKGWKPETRAKVIKENGGQYYSLLHLCANKKLVSTKDYTDAQECVEALRTSENTSDYFASPLPFEDDVEKFYQLKFKGDWNGISIRCMLDKIDIDHKAKKIRPIDLKTSFKPEWDFFKSFIQWGYWIQAQLYWYILRQNLDKHPLYKDYELLDYQFIIVSNNTRKPLVWEYSDTKSIIDLAYGKNNDIVCKNWRGIVEELNYYLTKNPPYPLGIGQVNDITYWLNK